MSVKTANQSNQGSGQLMTIITMMFLFGMIAFVTNLAAPVGVIWKNQMQGAGMLGNLMNFAAYLFMGIPAGKLLTTIGYKKTTLWALGIGFVGMALQYVSSLLGDSLILAFVIYLLGAFIGGFCVCMLNSVVNPMLNSIGGGGARGNQLLQIGGSFNSLVATLTPMLVGMLVGQVTNETMMDDVDILLLIAMGVFLVAFFIILGARIPEPTLQKKGAVKVKDSHSAWSFRHTVLGIIGIFFYVGLEVGIPGTLIFYLSDTTTSGAGLTGNATAIAGGVAAIYWLLMLCGRFGSSFISGKVSSRTQLIIVSTVAIGLVIAAIFIPKSVGVNMPAYSVEDGFSMASVPLSALLLVLCGLCTSVMWGGIFNLAVEGLGKYTSQASGLFMMMVVGGGIMPYLQELIANAAGYMTSYWLVVGMLGYLLFYGLIGSKNVNKDIPVNDLPTEDEQLYL